MVACSCGAACLDVMVVLIRECAAEAIGADGRPGRAAVSQSFAGKH